MSPTSYQAAPPREMILRELQRRRNLIGRGAKANRGPRFCFGGLFFAVLGWSGGLQGAQQARRNAGYFVDSGFEGLLIGLGRLGEATDFAHELQRGGVNLPGRDGWVEIEQRLDISAHGIFPIRLGTYKSLKSGFVVDDDGGAFDLQEVALFEV